MSLRNRLLLEVSFSQFSELLLLYFLKLVNHPTPSNKFSQSIVSEAPIFEGTSAAGLTIGMVKLADGTMIAQAGVLPLCSGGFAFIDEFDKMNKLDRSSMHEAMEQQTVSRAVAGVNLTLPAKTSILAAANPKFGKYDAKESLGENINVPPALLSRFDLIWLIKDKVDASLDMAKANHILDTYSDDRKIEKPMLAPRELMAYINYVREQKPVLSSETRREVLKIYEKMREL